MAFCVTCGSELQIGWAACPKCGTIVQKTVEERGASAPSIPPGAIQPSVGIGVNSSNTSNGVQIIIGFGISFFFQFPSIFSSAMGWYVDTTFLFLFCMFGQPICLGVAIYCFLKDMKPLSLGVVLGYLPFVLLFVLAIVMGL